MVIIQADWKALAQDEQNENEVRQTIKKRLETMTEQEYRKALHEINVKDENERRMLTKKFVTEHSPVKFGDYISDQSDTIRVEGWIISKRSYKLDSLPCLLYQGKTCKKDGTPLENPRRCIVHQSKLLRVNGEPVKNHGYGE